MFNITQKLVNAFGYVCDAASVATTAAQRFISDIKLALIDTNADGVANNDRRLSAVERLVGDIPALSKWAAIFVPKGTQTGTETSLATGYLSAFSLWIDADNVETQTVVGDEVDYDSDSFTVAGLTPHSHKLLRVRFNNDNAQTQRTLFGGLNANGDKVPILRSFNNRLSLNTAGTRDNQVWQDFNDVDGVFALPVGLVDIAIGINYSSAQGYEFVIVVENDSTQTILTPNDRVSLDAEGLVFSTVVMEFAGAGTVWEVLDSDHYDSHNALSAMLRDHRAEVLLGQYREVAVSSAHNQIRGDINVVGELDVDGLRVVGGEQAHCVEFYRTARDAELTMSSAGAVPELGALTYDPETDRVSAADGTVATQLARFEESATHAIWQIIYRVTGAGTVRAIRVEKVWPESGGSGVAAQSIEQVAEVSFSSRTVGSNVRATGNMVLPENYTDYQFVFGRVFSTIQTDNPRMLATTDYLANNASLSGQRVQGATDWSWDRATRTLTVDTTVSGGSPVPDDWGKGFLYGRKVLNFTSDGEPVSTPATWAEKDNADQIPAEKLTNAAGSTVTETDHPTSGASHTFSEDDIAGMGWIHIMGTPTSTSSGQIPVMIPLKDLRSTSFTGTTSIRLAGGMKATWDSADRTLTLTGATGFINNRITIVKHT